MTMILFIALMCHSHTSPLSLHTDPLRIVFDFMSDAERRDARVVSRRFNVVGNVSQSETVLAINQLFVFCNQTIDDDTFTKIKHIHNLLQFNALFLKWLPDLLRQTFEQNRARSNADGGDINYDDFDHYLCALGIIDVNNSLLNPVAKLLIRTSHKIFDLVIDEQIVDSNSATCFNSSSEVQCYLFVLDMLWRYMSSDTHCYNTSYRLPPLSSIPYLARNEEMYAAQTTYLKQLIECNGLIVWDPDLVQREQSWNAEHFVIRINAFVTLRCWWEDEFDEADFLFVENFIGHIQVLFILKVLECNEFDFESSPRCVEHTHFVGMVQFAVGYLVMHQNYAMLSELLFSLHQNNGLLCTIDVADYLASLCYLVDGKPTFVHFLVTVYATIPRAWRECNIIAISMFLWFTCIDRDRAMFDMDNLAWSGYDKEAWTVTIRLLIIILRNLEGYDKTTKQEYLDNVIAWTSHNFTDREL